MVGQQLVTRLRAYIERERRAADEIISKLPSDLPNELKDAFGLIATSKLTVLSEVEHILNAHGLD